MKQKKDIFDILFFFFWVIMTIIGIVVAKTYISLIEDHQEQIKVIANLGMMISTISMAVVIFYLKEFR